MHLEAADRRLRLDVREVQVPDAGREAVAALVSSWEFKRRAGFGTPEGEPSTGARGVLTKRLLGIRFAEPIQVTWASDRGFGYRAMPGHPLVGEESFALDEDGVFSARSTSRPASLIWWLAYPALRLLQWSTHRRYIRIVLAEAATAR
ncbi:MAG: DUF1990 family protein [Microbacteriaceae bacterium]